MYLKRKRWSKQRQTPATAMEVRRRKLTVSLKLKENRTLRPWPLLFLCEVQDLSDSSTFVSGETGKSPKSYTLDEAIEKAGKYHNPSQSLESRVI